MLSDKLEAHSEAYKKINDSLSDQILENILHKDPIFFEKLVVDLLLKMGYGEFRPDAGKSTSPTNDGGIDGIINEDRLVCASDLNTESPRISTLGNTFP